MNDQLANLFGISMVAFAVPFVLGFWPRLRVPAVVVEILLGAALGPDGLDILHVDATVAFLSFLGVLFLLFLAGLELDLRPLRGRPLRVGAVGFIASFAIAVTGALVLGQMDLVETPLVIAVAVCSTSVGIVIPVLSDTGNLRTPVGMATVAGGTVAEFGGIILLAVVLAVPVTSATVAAELAIAGVIVVGLFALALITMLGLIRRALSWEPGRRSSARMDETSSQLRTRLAVMLILGMALFSAGFGFEAILGTFIAGIFVGGLLHDDPHADLYRTRMEALGFGFLVPVFFVSTGIRLDLASVVTTESALKVLLFFVLLSVARGLPGLLYRSQLGTSGAVATGLMLATNLSFIVVTAGVGVETGSITQSTASSLVLAGLLSALIFPAAAQMVLSRRSASKTPQVVQPTEPEAG